MIRTEMGAADLTSSVMAAPEGEAFFELGMKYVSGRSGPADLVTAHNPDSPDRQPIRYVRGPNSLDDDL